MREDDMTTTEEDRDALVTAAAGALEWAAECSHASASDHLEAVALRVELHDLAPALVEPYDRHTRKIARYLTTGRLVALDRDARTKIADAVRAARSVVHGMRPPVEP